MVKALQKKMRNNLLKKRTHIYLLICIKAAWSILLGDLEYFQEICLQNMSLKI